MLDNLPPFYVGQKVCCIYGFENYATMGFNTPQVDKIYTIRNIVMHQLRDGMGWCVELVEVRNAPHQFADGFGEVIWSARSFVEPLTKTAKITLKEEMVKVLEKVEEFVLPN